MSKSFRIGVPVLLLMTLIVSACSTGSDEAMNEMDKPPVNYLEEDESLELENENQGENEEADKAEESVKDEGEDEQAVNETVKRELYLIDSNGLVVPQTIDIPKEEGVLRQSLEYLVEGGPVTELLPNGFKAVLPPGTSVSVNLQNNVATADFSNEFKEYNPELERQVLEAVTWTLTQFENVDQVKIQINGYEQDRMPVGGTPIGEGLSRADGINIETYNITDVVNSKGVTLYFLAQNGEDTYYVPVTRRVKTTEDDQLQVAVEQLLAGPFPQSNLLTDIRNGAELLEEPNYEDGLVTLNFNESILSQLQATAVSEEVLKMLALTLTEQEGVEAVALQVNGDETVLNESGEATEPVSRPTQVNAGSF